MIIALVITVLILVLIMLFRVPVYAIYGGILFAIVTFFGWAAMLNYKATDSEQEGAASAALALYLISGYFWMYHKRKEERDTAVRRHEAQQASAAYALGRFVYESDDFGDEVRRARAQASGDLEEMTPEVAILVDAMSIVRMIALPKDQILLSDAERLKLLCQGAGLWKMEHMSDGEMLKLIERAETHDVMSLSLLSEADSKETQDLRRRFLKFAKETCDRPKRKAAYRQTSELISTFAMTKLELLQQAKREAAKLADSLKSSIEEANRVRYDTLGVKQECTTEELRAAYRMKVAQWHPDKLNTMAPELQKMANEQLAKINEAFEFISNDRRMRSE
jgi:hypothetical protein